MILTLQSPEDNNAVRVSREVGAKIGIPFNRLKSELNESGLEVKKGNAMREYLQANGMKVIFGLWAGVIAATLMHNWKRRDISTGQKLVNARVVAQISALGGLGVLAYCLPSRNLAPNPNIHQGDTRTE